MKNEFLGLRTTINSVPDITAATEWYAKSFAIEPYFNEPFYVGFNIAGYELGLIPDGDNTQNKTANTVTYWGVKDVETTYQAFIKHGATPHEAPHNVGGEIVVAAVLDPWGNTIGFIYNPHFKAD